MIKWINAKTGRVYNNRFKTPEKATVRFNYLAKNNCYPIWIMV